MKHLLFALAGVVLAGLSTTVSAADLYVETPVMPGIVDVGSAWEGPYVGVFGGYGWGAADHASLAVHPDCAPNGCDVDIAGWLAGVTAGANFAVGSNVVAGIAGDIAWSGVSGMDTFGVGIADSENVINWQGSLRGVLGFDGGAFMPYLTAGFAVANATHTLSNGAFDGTADATHMGWTAGAGVAFAATEDVVIDLQYRYSDFGEQEYDRGIAPNNPIFGLTQHALTLGVNWQF